MATNTGKISTAKLVVCGLMVVVLLVVNLLLNTYKDQIAFMAAGDSKVTSGEMTSDEIYQEGYDVSVSLEGEGATLLKNKDNLLPFANGQKVTLLGTRTINYVLGGYMSAGGNDDAYTIMIDDAFNRAGLKISPKAWSWLKEACGGGRNKTSALAGVTVTPNFNSVTGSGNPWITTSNKILEFPVGTYQAAKDSIVEDGFTDVAVVVISRSGAEGASPSMDMDKANTTLNRTYLELDPTERSLLEFCKANYKNTLVLVNSAASMELGFIDSEKYNVGACLWMGHPGEAGMIAVAQILTGLVNPSGRLVDTYSRDLSTNPTYFNTDNNKYDNGQSFYQYEEGIYVGYRYYETADAAGYFHTDAFKKEGPVYNESKYKNDDREDCEGGNRDSSGGYDSVVQFPFGYGLSYTTFSETVASDDIKLAAHGSNSVTVKVTNTGKVAGKRTVQLYMEAPYKQDGSLGIKNVGLEKAKVTLIGFGKTKLLKPGESENITVKFETDDLASFDNFGKGCYVLEKGKYNFNIQDDAHCWSQTATDKNAVNATVTSTLNSTLIYNEAGVGKRAGDKIVAKNSMDDVTAGDGNMVSGYLSRNDFAAGMKSIIAHQSNESTREQNKVVESLPQNIKDAMKGGTAAGAKYSYDYTFQTYKNGELASVTKKMYNAGGDQNTYMSENWYGISVNDARYAVEFDKTYYVEVDTEDKVIGYDEGEFALYETKPEGKTARKLTVKDMTFVPADSDIWKKLVSMTSLDECINMQGFCGWQVPAVESVGKPVQVAKDGPGEPLNGAKLGAVWYPCAVIIAASFNVELAEKQGESYGNHCVLYDLGGAYSPAMNIHRSPFGGRNFEYYSEDGFLSGKIAGPVVEGLQSTGTNVYIKHLALNDGDTNRGGNTTWANEAAIREIYMKPYEICVKENDANGIMGSLNRIGMSWAHYGMYGVQIRDEWGFAGLLITDGDSNSINFNNSDAWLCSQGAMLSTGAFLTNASTTAQYGDGYQSTEYGKYMLQQVMKNALYQYAHSGQIDANVDYGWTVWWIVGNVVIIAGILTLATFAFLPLFKKKKQQ